ncbi:MAG: tetratricopeptide repeat protein [Caldilineaceae bacterium]
MTKFFRGLCNPLGIIATARKILRGMLEAPWKRSRGVARAFKGILLRMLILQSKVCGDQASSRALAEGVAMRAMGQSKQAVSSLLRAVELNPECLSAWRQLVELLLEYGEGASAISAVDRLARIMPKDETARRLRSQCLAKSRSPLAVLAGLLEALVLGFGPASGVRRSLDDLLFRSDLHLKSTLALVGSESSVGDLAQAPQLGADLLRVLSHECRRINRSQEAVAACMVALELEPDAAGSTMTSLALALARRGDSDGAMTWLARALERDPNHPGALMALGQLELDDGRPGAALTRFEQPADWPNPRSAALARAAALRALGREPEADVYLQASWAAPPPPWAGSEQMWWSGLRAALVQEAVLLPLQPATVPRSVRGGIASSGPAYLGQLRAEYDTDPVTTTQLDPPTAPGKLPELSGCHLYAGPFLKHFGHFVSECSHRLWGYRAYGSRAGRVLVLGGPTGSGKGRATTVAELLPFQREALNWFGIPLEQVTLVDRAMRVEQLIVPEQGQIFGGALPPPAEYLDLLAENAGRFFASYVAQRTLYPERMYISRAHLVHQGGIAGETYLEQLLLSAGFQIFRPEHHSLIEQLYHYSHARVCLFSEGSALHALELLGYLPRRPAVVVLGRRAETEAQWRRVVRPRTPQYIYCACTMQLPALKYDPVMRKPANWLGLSVVHELDMLIDVLNTHAGLHPGSFDRDAFHVCEAADIARYLLQTDMGADDNGGNYMRTWRRRLTAMSDNPYLSKGLVA